MAKAKQSSADCSVYLRTYGSLARLAAGALIASAGTVTLGVVGSEPAQAQSPSPQYTWADTGAENPNGSFARIAGSNGVIIEGDGWQLGGSCESGDADSANITQATINYVTGSVGTMTEMSPQSYCDSNTADWQYYLEGLAAAMYTYYYSQSCNYWTGIEVDEEFGPGEFGFMDSQMDSMNENVEQYLVELFSGCGGKQNPDVWGQPFWEANEGFGQSDYNNYKDAGSDYILMTPQIYTTTMAGFANNDINQSTGSAEPVMVTWDGNTNSFTYNTKTKSLNAIGAPNYCLSLDNLSCAYWSNEFLAG